MKEEELVFSQRGVPPLAATQHLSPALSPQCRPAQTPGLEELWYGREPAGEKGLEGWTALVTGGRSQGRCYKTSCGLCLSPAGSPDTRLGASPIRPSKGGPVSIQACHRFPASGLGRKVAGKASVQLGAWLRGQGHRASNTTTNTRGVLVGGFHLQGPKLRCQLPLPHTHPGLIWGLAELAERVGLSPGPPASNLDCYNSLTIPVLLVLQGRRASCQA